MKLLELFKGKDSSYNYPPKEVDIENLSKAQKAAAVKWAKRGGRKIPNENDKRQAAR